MFRKKQEEIMDEYDEIIYEEETEFEEEAEYLDEPENDDIEDSYEYEEPKNSRKKIKLIINIIFVLIILSLTMIAVDIISVARYNKGPYFAINTKTYKDGGSKEYYGIGYKVIKYNQVQGRRDMQIGTWSMPYSTEPTDISDLDLAIEFTEQPIESYEKYYKKFVRINSTLHKTDKKNNKIILGYEDKDGKYTLEIHCTMADKKSNINELKEDKEITIIGTVSNFELKDKKSNNKLYINNCFAEQ